MIGVRGSRVELLFEQFMCPLVYGVVVILVSISLAMSPRPRAGDLRASMRADQEGGGSVWVNQCSSMPVKQAPAT